MKQESPVGAGPRARQAIAKNIDAAAGTEVSKTHDFADVVDGARLTTTIPAPGAKLGDFVTAVSLGVDQAGVVLDGYVSADNVITVTLHNETGGNVNLASTTLRALWQSAS